MKSGGKRRRRRRCRWRRGMRARNKLKKNRGWRLILFAQRQAHIVIWRRGAKTSGMASTIAWRHGGHRQQRHGVKTAAAGGSGIGGMAAWQKHNGIEISISGEKKNGIGAAAKRNGMAAAAAASAKTSAAWRKAAASKWRIAALSGMLTALHYCLRLLLFSLHSCAALFAYGRVRANIISGMAER